MSVQGLITEIKDGKMTIVVQEEKKACEHCAARMFCKKSDDGANRIVLRERPGFYAGDTVSIEQERNILTKTSLLAYGIPLLFFTAGFFLGGLIPETELPQELIQFFTACLGLLTGGFIGRQLAKRLSCRLENYIIVKTNNNQ